MSIYQNPEHVAGLVQQIFNAPLVTNVVIDTDRTDEDKKNLDLAASAEAAGGFKVPLAGGVDAKLGANASRSSGTAITTSSRSSQSFVYSQAYYLDLVRQSLRDRALLVDLSDADSVDTMAIGDFVEFQATFTAPAFPSIMDVLTPDLVGAIVEFTTRRSGRDGIDFTNVAGLAAAAQELEMKASARRDLAASVTRALQADFRQEHTREYYGAITGVPGITAVTICDADRFLVEDEDRVLDGSYRVLGKVTSLPREDMPVFERNKMLSQIAPEAVDTMLGQVKGQLESQTRGLPIGQEQIDELMQVSLDSRVPGRAFQVIPIAIFV
ncbi:hypothetical protein EAO79_12025 [Plantibacter sp. PA-3-X8]|uniref:DUF6414 family protein n=1 Tax=Plantibacter sp. M259 TaxID=2583822 RepID=UPI000F6E7961|nr:hypothetical protein [Plantibacter sp. M259]AZH83546.1 hypothetical protein EAO79_12025 [Plantibacter sp. PA-3-X8]